MSENNKDESKDKYDQLYERIVGFFRVYFDSSKYWKNFWVRILGALAITLGLAIVFADLGERLYIKWPLIYEWTHSIFNGEGLWILAFTSILGMLGTTGTLNDLVVKIQS